MKLPERRTEQKSDRRRQLKVLYRYGLQTHAERLRDGRRKLKADLTSLAYVCATTAFVASVGLSGAVSEGFTAGVVFGSVASLIYLIFEIRRIAP